MINKDKLVFGLVLLSSLVLAACNSTTVPAASTGTTATATATSFSPIQPEAKNCFAAPYDSYQHWMQAMMAKNPADQKRKHMLNQRFQLSDYQRFAETVHCESFVYQVNGVPVVGFLLKPKHQQGKLPVLVFNRGGNGGFGAWMFGNIFYDLMPLAEQGYLVLASNYRGQIQPGGQQYVTDEFGGADVADVLAFKQLIPTITAADANKVAMIGHSRGGMQSWLAAKDWPELKALMILAGASDLQEELKVRPEMEKVFAHRIPDYHNNKEQQLKARSVVHFLPQVRADLPVLILHGDADKQVTVQSAYQIEALLKARNQPHKMVIYPQGDHGFSQYRTEIKQEILQFYPPAAITGS